MNDCHLAQRRYFDRASREWRTSSGGIPWCLSSDGTDEVHVVTDDESKVTCAPCLKHIQLCRDGIPPLIVSASAIDWFGEGE